MKEIKEIALKYSFFAKDIKLYESGNGISFDLPQWNRFIEEQIKEIKSTMYFHKLAIELKKWFDDREIDTGYTDTNVGHLSILVQEKIVKELEELESYINSHYIAKEKVRKLVVVHLDNFFEQVIGTKVTKDDRFKLKKEIIDLMVEDNK